MAEVMERAGLIADGVIRMRDWDPEAYTLGSATRATFTQAANDALRRAYGYQKWPTLMRTEARRYRPTWDTDATYETGQEVWWLDAYWRALQDHDGEEPAEGSAYWEKPEDFVPFIAFEQPWEEWAFDINGVDLKAFAWGLDPRQHPGMRAIDGCDLWMDSVVLPQGSPDRVWVRFVPRAPVISFEEYAAGRTYAAAEACYVTAAGRSYVALKAATGKNPVTETDYWREVGVPAFLSPYVRMAILSQWLTVAEGRYEMEGRAARELDEVAARHFERAGYAQGARMSVGRRR